MTQPYTVGARTRRKRVVARPRTLGPISAFNELGVDWNGADGWGEKDGRNFILSQHSARQYTIKPELVCLNFGPKRMNDRRTRSLTIQWRRNHGVYIVFKLNKGIYRIFSCCNLLGSPVCQIVRRWSQNRSVFHGNLNKITLAQNTAILQTAIDFRLYPNSTKIMSFGSLSQH